MWHFGSSRRDLLRMVGNPYLTGIMEGLPVIHQYNRGLDLLTEVGT
jgi:hypothetical protein